MQNLKDAITDFVVGRGVDLIGFAPVGRWEEANEVPSDFYPHCLWPQAKTVIVLGMGMPLPMVETTPSALHMELYNVCNRELDSLAFHLAGYLNKTGNASYFFPRDCYGSIKILIKKPLAAFSHVMAAKYAGLGTIGLSHNLLTPRFGPRVRLVSVFTAAEILGSPPPARELCIKCKNCLQCCPVDAFDWDGKSPAAGYDKAACARWHENLTRRRCYPCGICTKVCPVGEDRKKLYPEKGVNQKYLGEKDALLSNPDDIRYRNWVHVRNYGSWPENERKDD